MIDAVNEGEGLKNDFDSGSEIAEENSFVNLMMCWTQGELKSVGYFTWRLLKGLLYLQGLGGLSRAAT